MAAKPKIQTSLLEATVTMYPADSKSSNWKGMLEAGGGNEPGTYQIKKFFNTLGMIVNIYQVDDVVVYDILVKEGNHKGELATGIYGHSIHIGKLKR